MKKNSYLKIIIFFLIIGSIQTITYHPTIPENYVNTSFGIITYKTYGEGNKTLIAIHGSPGSKSDFDRLGPLLNKYTVYSIDMPGFGESTLKAKNYGFSQASKVLLETMNALNIEKAELIGYSWGGGVVSTFASTHPQRVEHLYLLAGVGVPQSSHTQHYWSEQLRSIVSFPFVVVYPGSFAPQLLDFNHRYGFIRSFYDSDQRLQYNIMRNINVPTTIIHGDSDTVVLLSGAKIHHQLIKNSTLYIYKGGHGKIYGNSSALAAGVRS